MCIRDSVGSLGGIMAIKKNEAHISPVHLLDEETGTYNLPFIEKYLNDQDILLLKGIKRWQGLYVQKGNPYNIKSISDIIKHKLTFANRQRGSGTRTLLDYYLKKEQINSEDIVGYKRELTTHTNVALSVQSGNAQVGLGIQSVGKLMDLDFIPLVLEDYDFIIPKKHVDTPCVQAFLNQLKSTAFRTALEKLGGYVVEDFAFVENT